MLAIKFILLVFSVLLGYTLGWYFTEEYRLAEKHRLFQFTVWQCRKCLSFHIAWVTSTFISLLFSDWIMFTIGIFFATMLHIGLRIDEKRRTISIEDLEI